MLAMVIKVLVNPNSKLVKYDVHFVTHALGLKALLIV